MYSFKNVNLPVSSCFFLCFVLLGRAALCFCDQRDFYASIPPVNFSSAESVLPTDISYKLFSSSDQSVPFDVTSENASNLTINRQVPAIFLIHGWTTDDTSPWYQPLKDHLLRAVSCNVFYVNWSKPGNKSYITSSANVKPVGKIIAQFIKSTKIESEQVHLIGHSLGAQLAGFIGKNLKELSGKKVARITALDPAGPSFENAEMDVALRLNSEDARFVDVVHTDVQYYGFTGPLGDVDFYVNAGKHQPGCPSRKDEPNCSHARSVEYFNEAFERKVFAKRATFEKRGKEIEIVMDASDNGGGVQFGYAVPLDAKGVFYLETNDTEPFLR